MVEKWKARIGLGLLALCVPALALAAPVKQELMLKAQQRMPAAAAAKSADRAKVREAQHTKVQELQAKKRELALQRHATLRDMARTGQINQQIRKVNYELKTAGKGGAR